MGGPGAAAQLTLELVGARGWETRIGAGEREGDLGAVGLVADRHHRRARAVDSGEDVVRGGARREPLVDPSSTAAAFAIATAVSRARRSGLETTASGSLGGQPLGEHARLLAAAGTERAQRVRVAGVGVGVTDEDQPHGWRIDSAPMRSFRYVLADVFTDTPLAGNQLAVFTDARDLDELTMQALALELGLSETVFVLPPREGGTVRVRIFTPQQRARVRRPSLPRRGLRARRAAPARDDRARDRQRASSRSSSSVIRAAGSSSAG